MIYSQQLGGYQKPENAPGVHLFPLTAFRHHIMPADHVRVGPDAPIENYIIRIARAHTNDRQHGARTIEMYRSLPERFKPATAEG